MRRLRIITVSLAACAALLSVAAPSQATLSSSADPAIEQSMLAQLNGYRVSRGLVPLKTSANLTRAARFHSRDMAENGYFDHTSPDGEQFFSRLTRFGYHWMGAGEAIGEASGLSDADDAATSAITMWQHSPPHNKILLTASYRNVGIGAWCAPGDDDVVTCTFTLDAARS
jgi:uncharacterized protein YkwD